MALFDRFKTIFKKEKEKKEKVTEVKEKKPLKKKEEVVLVEKKEKEPLKKKKTPRITFGKVDIGEAYRILKYPLISEKATNLTQRSQYIFKVAPGANKPEVKKAIQNLYGVKVTGVRMINIPRKPRRLGRTEGYKPGLKKAVVSLKEGEKIEVLPR